MTQSSNGRAGPLSEVDDELPPGWERAPIGSLCSLVNGRAFKPTEWHTQGVPIVRIQNLNNTGAPYNYFDGDLDKRHRLVGGELLFAWSGTPGTSFGAHIWKGGTAALNQHIFRVDFDTSLLDKRFFKFSINERLNDLINVAQGGVGLRHVTKGVFEATQVLVPPRAEQTRIADKLDTLLARIHACQDRLESVPALLKRFRQAVLVAATDGSLTADWRENRETPAWVPTSIGDLLDGKPRNGYSPKSVDYETSVRSLSLSATTSGRFLSQHSKFIDEPVSADSHLWLEPGDILIQRANTLEYVGVSAIFDGPPQSFIYPDLMMKCRPNNRVDGRFLYLLLSAEPTRRYFRDHATGTAGNMPKINQQTVMSAPVDLPPRDEQVEIVRRANRLLHALSQLEQRHTAVAAHTRRLADLTLAKAFRGEIVPQNSSDEPASTLLARFATQRKAPTVAVSAPTSRRVRPPRAPKEPATMTKSRQDDDVMGQPYLARHLRRLGAPASAEALFKVAELPVGDFYKQLAWEVAQGHVTDNQTTLEPNNAAG